MAKVYCPLFLGQGGYLFSMGMVGVARKLRAIGAETQAFSYGDYERARSFIRGRRIGGRKIAGVGFSLGCTALTYLALEEKFELVLCIAASAMAGPNNHPVNHSNIDRSVLWRNPTEALSAGGADRGFDMIVDLYAPHLLMPGRAADSVVAEVKRLF